MKIIMAALMIVGTAFGAHAHEDWEVQSEIENRVDEAKSEIKDEIAQCLL